MNHLIYGLHAVEAAIKQGNVLKLFVLDSRQDNSIRKLISAATPVSVAYLSRKQLDQMTDDANHQGVVAELAQPLVWLETDLLQAIKQSEQPALILILDQVQDPHNLGACLRSANAAGALAVVAPKDKSVGLTATVRKVACGATEHTPFVQVTNLARFIQTIAQLGVWVYGLCGETEKSLFTTDFTGHTALVLGAEGKGLRQLTREHCDELLAIPMIGSVESLNVSVAAGICLFEVLRQRQR